MALFEEEIVKNKGARWNLCKEEREYSSFPISSGYLCVRKSLSPATLSLHMPSFPLHSGGFFRGKGKKGTRSEIKIKGRLPFPYRNQNTLVPSRKAWQNKKKRKLVLFSLHTYNEQIYVE